MYKHKLRYVVFTDASFKKRNGSSYCGYGAVVVNLETNQYVSFSGELSDRSIVFGESWAIIGQPLHSCGGRLIRLHRSE